VVRDLLYLSETKMKDLAPQLPRKALKRLGMEAGLNVGVLSLRATLSPSEQTSQVALLDSVINMIENSRLTRRRSDPDLHAGDWVQFEEAFVYGRTPPTTKHPLPPGELVYFNAVAPHSKGFSLCGLPSHLKGAHYNQEDEEAGVSIDQTEAMLGIDSPSYADTAVAAKGAAGRLANGVNLAGHARILSVFDDFVLGTPLYVEYVSTGN
jgi:hypothetical protein